MWSYITLINKVYGGGLTFEVSNSSHCEATFSTLTRIFHPYRRAMTQEEFDYIGLRKRPHK